MGLDIYYVPRTSIKSQALADFDAEWTDVQGVPALETSDHWMMYFDRSLTLNGARSGVVLLPRGDCLQYALQLHFKATNNVAEYEALLNDLGVRCLYVRDDSKLVVNQVMKESSCRDSHSGVLSRDTQARG